MRVKTGELAADPRPELAPAQALLLADSLPEPLVIATGAGSIYFANRHAWHLLAIDQAVSRNLAECGPRGLALLRHVEGMAGWVSRWPQRAQLELSIEETLHVLTLRAASGVHALFVHVRHSHEAELQVLLRARLGCSHAEARLALQVYRGWPNARIAEALGLPVGTVSRRVSELSKKLKVRRRAGIGEAVCGVAHDLELQFPRSSPAPTAPLRNGPPTTPLGCALVASVLEQVPCALALHDGQNSLVWANREARVVLFGHEDRFVSGGVAAVRGLTRGVVALAPLLEHGPQTTIAQAGDEVLRCQLWRVGPLLGLHFHSESSRALPLAVLLCRRFGLSPRQAAIAARFAQGETIRQVAQALEVQEGTIRALNDLIYTRLGIHSKVELVTLLAGLSDGMDRGW
jgi:DNA-binding NarL/FixJ family response regulator